MSPTALPISSAPASSPLASVVADARRCLARSHVVAALRGQARVVLVAAAVAAASRPVLWPLGDVTAIHALSRTAVLAGSAALLAAAGVALHAWRTRPSLLGAARRLDAALGLPEVIASGFAFERDRRTSEATDVAIERARRATEGVVLSRALATKPAPRTKREARWVRGALAALVVGLAIGGVDRLAIENVLHPVTKREAAEAAELRRAAAIAEEAAKQGEVTPQMLEAAQRAAAAAERGDRNAAHEALEDLRKATRDRDSAEREKAAALRALRDQLDGKSGQQGNSSPEANAERPAVSAAEALARTMRELEQKKDDPEAVKRLAERLAKAEAAARAASEAAPGGTKRPSGAGSPGGPSNQESAWSEAAKALEEAREAAARGDAEGAKRALERAEKAIAELEKKRDPGAARALAKLSEGASSLDRALANGAKQRGGAGDDKDEPGEGDGAGKPDGKSDGQASGAGSGDRDEQGAPSAGGGKSPGDRTPGSERGRLKTNGSLQARTDAKEGERAVSVIEGMGKGGDPKAYREIFPAYDTAVEDGLREDLVPAARRDTVRRYFHSIRPGNEPKAPPSERQP